MMIMCMFLQSSLEVTLSRYIFDLRFSMPKVDISAGCRTDTMIERVVERKLLNKHITLFIENDIVKSISSWTSIDHS